MDTTRHEFLFVGRVQGVGFRYTACRIAERHAVTGWVKNLPDGTVQMVVEAADNVVEAYIEELSRTVNAGYGHITDAKREPVVAATGEFRSFSIR